MAIRDERQVSPVFPGAGSCVAHANTVAAAILSEPGMKRLMYVANQVSAGKMRTSPQVS
jgi:hypothetical protein